MPDSDDAPDATAIPDDLQARLAAYADLFGSVPPLPQARYAFVGDVAPDALREQEAVRDRAFFDTPLDAVTTQLMLFGLLLAAGSGAARHHAHAARRAGASWEQLQAVADLAAAVAMLGPANQAGQILYDLRQSETD